MFIIFGWGHQKIDNYGAIYEYQCEHCNNVAKWELIKSSVWFTFFFIPIFPYEVHYYLTCPICSWGVELNRAESKMLKERFELAEGLFKRSLKAKYNDDPVYRYKFPWD